MVAVGQHLCMGGCAQQRRQRRPRRGGASGDQAPPAASTTGLTTCKGGPWCPCHRRLCIEAMLLQAWNPERAAAVELTSSLHRPSGMPTAYTRFRCTTRTCCKHNTGQRGPGSRSVRWEVIAISFAALRIHGSARASTAVPRCNQHPVIPLFEAEAARWSSTTSQFGSHPQVSGWPWPQPCSRRLLFDLLLLLLLLLVQPAQLNRGSQTGRRSALQGRGGPAPLLLLRAASCRAAREGWQPGTSRAHCQVLTLLGPAEPW